MEDKEDQEFYLAIQRYPPDWMATLSNSGKVLVVFDRAQQTRNKYYKYKENKQEIVAVYQISLSKVYTMNPRPYYLDMLELLGGQETLSFGIDDYSACSSIEVICVYGKDLNVYFINYEQHELLRKVCGEPLKSMMPKSIFFDGGKRAKNLPYFEHLKQYVEDEESRGNRVRMPKLNEEVVVVLDKNTVNIRLYHTKKKRVIRQLKLSMDAVSFDAERFTNADFHEAFAS